MTIGKFIIYILLSVALLPSPACTKKDAGWQPTDSIGKINKWVYDSMAMYYYWSADMPPHPDYSLPTEQFFKQLLSPNDRFSWISNRTTIGATKTAAETYGFYYSFTIHPFDQQKLIGVITSVIPGSNANNRGLKRGMLFSAVNDRPITVDNKKATKEALQAAAATLQLAAFNTDRSALVDSARIGVQSAIVPQKSVYATHVFENNGKKTGYLAYYLCAEKDDAVMLQSIQKLQQQGVTEFILDLRYNPGGSVASATKLAALLTSNFNAGNKFITYRGNKHGGTVVQTFQQAISFSSNAAGKSMSDLQAWNLNLSRVYILTSAETASAAELLTHNLEPYTNVVRIGEITLGKDEASFPIEDQRNPRQVAWVIMPIVYKIADANGKGDYATGLTPHHAVVETSKLPLAPIGKPGDLPVDKAFMLIYGTTAVSVTVL
ncbi:C-terminal processing protease CtpA/Prc [Chitinophagaceae bacterium OAS944]|uniref:S41 family peptidase n=1 Tax=Niastella sp. OAS944 TaxID=2664089 RepID=UPI0035C78BE1|nr:C-terminal processing protease CtpA/Prc [Chitinophagaceae bacterium OAS944]